jgi:hypothetical protein
LIDAGEGGADPDLQDGNPYPCDFSRPPISTDWRTAAPNINSARAFRTHRFVSTQRDYSDALNGASRNPRIIKRRRDLTYRSWAARHNASADAKT